MPRRFTNQQRTDFARYVLQHPVESFDLGMDEYLEVCRLLEVVPNAVKKSKFVNLINMNRLLGEFKANKEKWVNILNKSVSNIAEEDVELDTFENRNDNCQCEHCVRRSRWGGKLRYKFSQYTYKETNLLVTMEHSEWQKYSTLDGRGNLKLKRGYSGSIISGLKKAGWACTPACKDNYYLPTEECLRIAVYCTMGDEKPCNLLHLDYYPNDKSCNLENGVKRFIVKSTDFPVRHCTNTYKVPQLRGEARSKALCDASKMMPKAHGNYLIVNYGEENYVIPKDKWPVSQPVLKNLRSEWLNQYCVSTDLIQQLLLMWTAEKLMPPMLKQSNEDFRYFQYLAIGPVQVVLSSDDQLSILQRERERYEANSDVKAPRFATEIDATSGICSAVKGCEDKRRDNYAIVRPIQIPGDNSSPKMITSFADYITTDQSSRSIFFFLNEFKENFIIKFGKTAWPPMNAMVSDFCWAQINAIIKLNGLDVVQYLNLMYDYISKNDEELAKKVDDSTVLVFLCITHFSKNFLKDVGNLAEDDDIKEVVKVIFVEMIHCRRYEEVLKYFEALTKILVDPQADIEVNLRQLNFEEATNFLSQMNEFEEKPYEKLDDPIYKRSPFYNDAKAIYDKIAKNDMVLRNESFMLEFMKRYMTLVPLWTSICHIPKSSRHIKYPERFRFNTNHMESYWCDLKEGLRSNVLAVGKLPIPADRFVRAKKDETRATIIRYRNSIPKNRLNCRPKTYRNSVKTPKTAATSEITDKDISTAESQWKRVPKKDKTPHTTGLSFKRERSKLFNMHVKDIVASPSLKTFMDMKEKLRINSPGKTYYVGKSIYKSRKMLIDIVDITCLADNEQLYESTLDVALSMIFANNKDTYVCEIHEGRQLFGFGLYTGFVNLNPQMSSNQRTLVENLMKKKKLIVPLLHKTHFYLVSIDLSKKHLELFNSLVTESSLTAKTVFDKWMEVLLFFGKPSNSKNINHILNNQQKWSKLDINTTQQKDFSSCGIFVCYFAEQISNGKKTFTGQINVSEKRQEIFKLLRTQLTPEDICFNCGGDLDANSKIRCEHCGRNCCPNCFENSNLGDKKHKFICNACK